MSLLQDVFFGARDRNRNDRFLIKVMLFLEERSMKLLFVFLTFQIWNNSKEKT